MDEVWMTYDDAAEAMGIKRSSVQRRAAMRKWPKKKGNGKFVLVGIPASALPSTADDASNAHSFEISNERSHDDIAKIAGLEAENFQIKERLDDARTDNARLLELIAKKPVPGFIARIFSRG